MRPNTNQFLPLKPKTFRLLLITLVLGGLWWCSAKAVAQIVDDSTTSDYSTRTTWFFNQHQLLADSITLNRYDTLAENLERYDALIDNRQPRQDLGNYGTANAPIFFSLPNQIGLQNGFSAYDFFAPNPDSIKYYHTLSPYSRFYYTNGNQDQEVLKTSFARNINPQLNLGFDFNIINTGRQIGADPLAENQTRGYYFVLHGNYYHPSGKYVVAAHYSFFDHQTFEPGGAIINVKDGETKNDLFDYEVEETNLSLDARSRDDRHGFNLLQTYSPTKNKKIMLYHKFGFIRQNNRYYDESPTTATPGFYPQFRLDSAMVQNVFRWVNFQNTVGAQWRLGPKITLRAHYRRKDFSFANTRYGQARANTLADTTTASSRDTALAPRNYENFVGGQIKFKTTHNSQIYATGEGAPAYDYYFKVGYKNSWLHVWGQRMFYSPTLALTHIAGNVYHYHRPGFTQQTAHTLRAEATLKIKKWLVVKPYAQYFLIDDLAYFNAQAMPEKATETITLSYVGARWDVHLGKVHWLNNFCLTNSNNFDVMSIPETFYWTQVYFSGQLWGSLNLRAGVEAWSRAAYNGYKYNPVLQQFYVNNNFNMSAYIKLDAFVTASIKNFRLFMRYTHLNQGLGAEGYFTTPYYPGMRTGFEYGFGWLLFD